MIRSILALPMAALLAATPALAAPAPADGQPLAITLTNRGIFPARIGLAAGKAYSLRFFNKSDRKHDFAVKSFFADARIQGRDLPKLDDGRVSLEPGQRTTIRLLAPRNPGGRYEFSSTQLRDANSGLKGNIFIR